MVFIFQSAAPFESPETCNAFLDYLKEAPMHPAIRVYELSLDKDDLYPEAQEEPELTLCLSNLACWATKFFLKQLCVPENEGDEKINLQTTKHYDSIYETVLEIVGYPEMSPFVLFYMFYNVRRLALRDFGLTVADMDTDAEDVRTMRFMLRLLFVICVEFLEHDMWEEEHDLLTRDEKIEISSLAAEDYDPSHQDLLNAILAPDEEMSIQDDEWRSFTEALVRSARTAGERIDEYDGTDAIIPVPVLSFIDLSRLYSADGNVPFCELPITWLTRYNPISARTKVPETVLWAGPDDW